MAKIEVKHIPCDLYSGGYEQIALPSSAVVVFLGMERDSEECDDPKDTLMVAEADSSTVEVLKNISPSLSPPREEIDSG